ncbi:MAG TPA: hypothetical protein VGD26_10450 [Chitinophagaceae bacterium]
MPLYYVQDIDSFVLLENGDDHWFVNYQDALESTGIVSVTPITTYAQFLEMFKKSNENDQ